VMGRAVCLSFAAALRRFGVPGEVLTNNGKRFTDRFGTAGRCCSAGSAATTGSPTGLLRGHGRHKRLAYRSATLGRLEPHGPELRKTGPT
jgi:hypothetical protein